MRWIILIATVFMTLVFAYALPIAFRNPSTSNILITIVLGIVVALGFWTAVKGKKPAPTAMEINGQQMTPVE